MKTNKTLDEPASSLSAPLQGIRKLGSDGKELKAILDGTRAEPSRVSAPENKIDTKNTAS